MADLEELIERDAALAGALHLAATAHGGQTDKAGAPYLTHILRMVTMALNAGGDPNIAVVAALHDIVEDTVLSFDDLRDCNFSEAVVDAVEALTRREGESYCDFITRCGASGDLARAVKQIDIEDNLRPERLACLAPAERSRLDAKYRAALQALKETQHDR